ncbi:BTAD domain-containing putative transcriptional regulator [[Mycobacterium] nativiensis]|uniref:BTAD domain-containing putative transcriptional regulator n=2 Tax=[Mycobacterium] nativiensis TaxID=2855503 RepID=A0ABU5XY13_9MYCO|nr:BTAD domain-containing putative transcriptional regulator [Mycolicibacter sp. MYC340]MEB3032874.1 BTAD domain-containing putative transcriptional regulator [Mycolicibacter sp. MYC340]
MELGVLGPLQARRDSAPVTIPGAKPRAILTMLGLYGGSVVSADTLTDLLWGDDPPRTAAKALQTHISSLRRVLGDGFVVTDGLGWMLRITDVDAPRYKLATKLGRAAAAVGDTTQAVVCFEEAMALWRGTPELPDSRRGISEKTRWSEGHAALVEDRADALLAAGRAAEIVGELEAAVADAPLRERRWAQLMLALYRAGRQGEALGAYQRARSLLADELGIDPGPELRRLEAAIVTQDTSLDYPVAQHLSSVTRAVTFLLTDIEGSTTAWEADADAMAVALARHDELAEQVVTSRGGRLIKTRGEGDATFSVFERPSAAAAAALELQEAIRREPWALREPIRIRVALHTGEVELRDGDYFGRAVNRAARLRSLAVGGQILCSGATAELVIDALPDDVALADLGMRQLRNLPRPEHVFELRLEAATRPEETSDAPLQRPALPAILTGPGPFVGRSRELGRLAAAWQTTLTDGIHAVLIAGEPGIGKTRLAGEWSRQAYEYGAVVLYGRSDEDLGAPYQPFAEALRSLVPCIEPKRLRGLRGLEALLALVPGLADALPDLVTPPRADPDTERYALFDAAVALLELASASAPVVLILDDLHWAAKPTLLLLRHLLRFGDHTRLQVVATYRSTDLDRSHPLAAMLADLHRDGTADRLQLSGLDEDDVTAYVTEAGHDDEELAHALASVTGGNPFFLIEALRHVAESGGVWDPSTLPQGVREAVSRRLSRLPAETNKALAAAAVVGSRFALELVERVVDQDLVDAFDEAYQAGIVIEESGGRYRFNHAIVRQSLLAELPSVRRMRLHQRIATTLEGELGADDELLAELAYHYFECAWAGNAAKAVEYCRRAADQAMARLAYEGAADLYDQALHALDEIDEEVPDRDEQAAELLIARCEALLAAGDVVSAAGAVAQLQAATIDSVRLAAWATCFDGQLSMLIHPERLDDVEFAVGEAAGRLAQIADASGEAKAHTVRAGCLARLGRIGDCEDALDDALTAARRAGEHRRVNAVLANAPLAALWGPNPVPRAGGRCLDVVRLLRITTDSPAVEATSTRCQALLEAFRGRTEAARQMIDSARRTITELGLRHALLEVEQFAGIVELVADDPGAAEPHLRKAYHGFRRMGLDADTAETAAMLGRACLALDRDAEAAELCSESERLAGHALKASISWRTLRALLLARRGEPDEARRMAQAAVGLAERTDLLVDHGDACLALATVLGAAGDAAGARAAAEQSVGLYERKGAGALADMARLVLGQRITPPAAAPPEEPAVAFDTAAVRVGERVMAAAHRYAWDELEQLFAPDLVIESRRKVVGLSLPSDAVRLGIRRELEAGTARIDHVMIAARGERLALSRLITTSPDTSRGAPHDELLQLFGIDDQGRVALQIWFDVEDIDAAIAELDALHARFEAERASGPRAWNKAALMIERFYPQFAARDWVAIAQAAADNYVLDDRRRMVNIGIRRGRDAGMKELQATADVGFGMILLGIVATRGERLVLTRVRASGPDPGAVQNDALNVIEIDSDDKAATAVVFDVDDFDAAIAELDARYIAGEAADYSHAWSAIANAYAAFNRREVPAAEWITIDHRRATPFEPSNMTPSVRSIWDLTPDLSIHLEAVHRLNSCGAVITHVGHATSREGFPAEWRAIDLLVLHNDRIERCEVFDENDLDAALARFEELDSQTPRLENAAGELAGLLQPLFAARDWTAVATMLADNFVNDDRRRVVGSGIRHGRDATVTDAQATAGLFTNVTTTFIATRGTRLVLARNSFAGSDQESGAFLTEALSILEINADQRATALVTFDLGDFDAAMAELDARYIAGEAAAYSRTWSLTTQAYTAFNRHQISPLAPDWVNIDHRRGLGFPSGEMIPYIQASWNITPDVKVYIESVRRLSASGTVITAKAHGTSQEGFATEWRYIHLLTFKADLISRGEFFDEADLASALARFDELQAPKRLGNTASQVAERFGASFAVQDWDAMAELLADDASTDDRRQLLGVGVRCGRDTVIADWRATADVGVKNLTSTVIATRGQRLVLSRLRFGGGDQRPEAFHTDVLGLVELDANQRIESAVMLDLDEIDAAFSELDARYLVGEAAPHAHTWSVITDVYATVNRHEMPAVNWVNVDHRRGMPFTSSELAAAIRSFWDLTPKVRIQIEMVHRLSDIGAVLTHYTYGTSLEGIDVEWRMIHVLVVADDRITRCEIFDETDLDAALARFEQLSRPAPRLENSATQVSERAYSYIAARDWQAVAQTTAENVSVDDRRRVVNSGILHGRDVNIKSTQATVDVGFTITMVGALATRGARLALIRVRVSGHDPEAIQADALSVVEIDADERIVADVVFDPDEIDAAFAELDTRYLTGEAAAHARTWSVIAEFYAAISRHEPPATTPDWVSIDHRRGTTVAPGDAIAYIRASLEGSTGDIYVETVHRLSNLAAVVTFAGHGTSPEGFEAEWRGVNVFTVEGDLINRGELFDETDIDAALARYDELSRPTPRLENTASRMYERFNACLAARDWDAMGEMIADEICDDDRRQVVSGGIRCGRDAQMANLRAIVDVGVKNFESFVIATRGERVALSRARVSGGDQHPEAFGLELLTIIEIDTDNRIAAGVTFDLNDIDAAFAELDTRYLAGEAADHAHTWSVVTSGYAAFNRREFRAPDWVNIDHRRARAFAPGELTEYMHATWDLAPNITVYVETVHRLSSAGAVITHVARGTSQEGFDAEWRDVVLFTVDGDLFDRCEIFEESDLDAALARFDALTAPD